MKWMRKKRRVPSNLHALTSSHKPESFQPTPFLLDPTYHSPIKCLEDEKVFAILIQTPYSPCSTNPSPILILPGALGWLNDTLDNNPVAYTHPAALEEVGDTALVEVEQGKLNTEPEVGPAYSSDMVHPSMEGVDYHIHYTAQQVAVAAVVEGEQQQQERIVDIRFLGAVQRIVGWHNWVRLQAIGGTEGVVDARRIVD